MTWKPLILISISLATAILLAGSLALLGKSNPDQTSSYVSGIPDEDSAPEDLESTLVYLEREDKSLDPFYYDYDDLSSVNYFMRYQFEKAEKDQETGMYIQDCNRNQTMKNAVIVALQERHYGGYFPHYMQDMDDTKCALFKIFSNGPPLTELPLINIRSSEEAPTSCPVNAVMTAWYDDNNMFEFPDKVRCSSLPAGFRLGSCENINIVPEEGKENPYERYISPYRQPADERWPMQCPQLPDPSALVSFIYHKNREGKPYWRTFTCCTIEQAS